MTYCFNKKKKEYKMYCDKTLSWFKCGSECKTNKKQNLSYLPTVYLTSPLKILSGNVQI